MSKDELITFVYYTPDPPAPEWRRCKDRSGQITNINSNTITFTEDYNSDSVTVSYSLTGATLTFSWSDGEKYHMTVVDSPPYTEGSATYSFCFN